MKICTTCEKTFDETTTHCFDCGSRVYSVSSEDAETIRDQQKHIEELHTKLDAANCRKAAWKTAAKWYRQMVGTYKGGCTKRNVIIEEYRAMVDNQKEQTDEARRDALFCAKYAALYEGNKMNIQRQRKKKFEAIIAKYEERRG